MDSPTIIGMVSIVIAGLTMAVGAIAPSLSQGRAVAEAMNAIARQPDEANTITRTLYVGLALIETVAIYSFLVAMILIFFNPFWDQVVAAAGG